jgi:hypothetical protein
MEMSGDLDVPALEMDELRAGSSVATAGPTTEAAVVADLEERRDPARIVRYRRAFKSSITVALLIEYVRVVRRPDEPVASMTMR